MDSVELNAALAEIADRTELAPVGLGGGKAVAYFGWFWRNVNFDRPISFAYANGGGWDVPSWVGFCENNKWDYDEFTCTGEQSSKVRALCETLASEPNQPNAQLLFDYMQSLRPSA